MHIKTFDILMDKTVTLSYACRSVWRIKAESRQQLVWTEPLLYCRSTKSVCHIISELKLQDRYDYRKHFRMNSETDFLISCLQFNLT